MNTREEIGKLYDEISEISSGSDMVGKEEFIQMALEAEERVQKYNDMYDEEYNSLTNPVTRPDREQYIREKLKQNE